MAIYISDPEVDRLAGQVAARHGISKTEAVRRALRHELEDTDTAPDFVERAMALTDALRARSNPENGLPVDKAFIDGLYE